MDKGVKDRITGNDFYHYEFLCVLDPKECFLERKKMALIWWSKPEKPRDMFSAAPNPFSFYDSHILPILKLKIKRSRIIFLTQTTLTKQICFYSSWGFEANTLHYWKLIKLGLIKWQSKVALLPCALVLSEIMDTMVNETRRHQKRCLQLWLPASLHTSPM